MAIMFKTGVSYGQSIMGLFGVEQAMIEEAEAKGVEVGQSSPGTFVVSVGSSTYGTIPIKGMAISLAKAGELGPASKQAIKYQFESALKKAFANHPSTASSSGAPVKIIPPKKGGLNKPKYWDTTKGGINPSTSSPKDILVTGIQTKLDGLAVGKADHDAEHDDEYDEDLYPTKKFPSGKGTPTNSDAAPVLLKKATSLYQPVFGTSVGSTYYVVALLNGCNLAVRISSGTLSVRLEGGSLHKYASAMDDLGITAKKGYASVHFSVGSVGLLHKTIGAILGRIGFDNIKEVADMSKIPGGEL